jgi:hypothetical protein
MVLSMAVITLLLFDRSDADCTFRHSGLCPIIVQLETFSDTYLSLCLFAGYLLCSISRRIHHRVVHWQLLSSEACTRETTAAATGQTCCSEPRRQLWSIRDVRGSSHGGRCSSLTVNTAIFGSKMSDCQHTTYHIENSRASCDREADVMQNTYNLNRLKKRMGTFWEPA